MRSQYFYLLLAAVVGAALIAPFYAPLGSVGVGLLVVAYYLTLALTLLWALSRLVARFRPKFRTFRLRNALKAPLLLTLTGGAAILSLNITAPPPVLTQPESILVQLTYLYETDQRDRHALRIFIEPRRDAVRLAEIYRLNDGGEIRSGEEKYLAAMVLHHGTSPDDYALAHTLSSEAAAEGVEGAQWLS